jgi:hypothetical protein
MLISSAKTWLSLSKDRLREICFGEEEYGNLFVKLRLEKDVPLGDPRATAQDPKRSVRWRPRHSPKKGFARAIRYFTER